MNAPAKFSDRLKTADGTLRATVSFTGLDTLWFNTGTLCNLACINCYIESSPTNDQLVYLTASEVATYLDELAALSSASAEIGFTGGEPFMNPEFVAMLEDALNRGHEALVLTNAMRPMMKCAGALTTLADRHHEALKVRVSVDHYQQEKHAQERGAKSWQSTLDGLVWLNQLGVSLSVAGRTYWGESEQQMREGYQRLFNDLAVNIDANDPGSLILFPEMDEQAEVPEITVHCWDILNVSPSSIMCANSRMIVKRKGSEHCEVTSCTLLPYADGFSLGSTLAQSFGAVSLNHPHCAKFCVLGGASCSQ